MRVKAFLVGVGILSAAALGCSDDKDSAERLYGTWDISAVGSSHTWEPDGTWHVATSTGGVPYNFGTYTVEGSIVTIDTDPDAGECAQTTGSLRSDVHRC